MSWESLGSWCAFSSPWVTEPVLTTVKYQTLESPLGNEYLNASTLPILPPWADLPTPLDNNFKGDTLPPLPSHSSQPDVSRSNFTLSTAPVLKRTSSIGPYRQSTLAVPASNVKKRMSGIGVASSLGRLFKVLADFFLLAGRLEDAGIWYSYACCSGCGEADCDLRYNEAVQTLRSQDVLWRASALEGLATLSILEAWAAGHGLVCSLFLGVNRINEAYSKLLRLRQKTHGRIQLTSWFKQHHCIKVHLHSTATKICLF